MEFGYEMYQEVPRVWQMCQSGMVNALTICKGRYAYYYFVPFSTVREKDCAAEYADQDLHAQHRYRPVSLPPYKSVFSIGEKDVAFFYNKYNREWAGPPVNFWSASDIACILKTPCLRDMEVIFSQPDNVPEMGTGDSIGMVMHGATEMRGVTTVPSDLDLDTFNVLQLILLSSARLAIGVQGGRMLASALVGTPLNVVLCRRGYECQRDLSWYPFFANSTFVKVKSADAAVAYLSSMCRGSAFSVTSVSL